MKINIIIIIITLLISKISFAESLHYRLFKDFVQYSSSVDAYSMMCTKGFEADKAKSELFDLINLFEIDVKLTEEDIDLVFAINVRSLLTLSIALAPSMKARGGGSIINVSSVAGIRGPGARVAYAGTKGAVDAMTRALASDWGPDGIRVNSIAPGLIATAIWEESRNTVPGLIEDMEGQIALKRWGFGDDIADVVAFFASDSSRYVTGETLVVDGGLARVTASAQAQVLPELLE